MQNSIYSKLKVKNISKVEQYYLELSRKKLIYEPTEKIPIIQVDNFPELGKLTALRFIEWVQNNPGGVISLPTGKTPEHFIKWVSYFVNNWKTKKVKDEIAKVGLDPTNKPQLKSLHFVQIDEFYPINSAQHNSFYFYIQKYYISNLGLDPRKALLINTNKIGTAENLPLNEVFPDQKVDLSLRTRFASNRLERLQKKTIEIVDEFCTNYENKIREMGGIGFFLGGIGPDGHIGFNVKGSDHFSTTRLTETNYETQAAAATDLGGIEVARNRLVITIGLNTITYKKDATAIIIAAGEAKANIIKASIENGETNEYPATVLQKLKNARFYLTNGAALRLTERRFVNLQNETPLSQASMERAVINLAKAKNKQIKDLTINDYKNDKLANLVLKKTGKSPGKINALINTAVNERFNKGLAVLENETILHTAPHHDDIMLGYLPYIVHLVRTASNKHHFTTLTSGFTAVTNSYMIEVLEILKGFLRKPEFKKRFKKNYFKPEFIEGRNRDVNLYLDGIAFHSRTLKNEATSRRLLRNLVELYGKYEYMYLQEKVKELIKYFQKQYPGQKDIPQMQKYKGMLREWEEEILWAYLGFNSDSVSHLRLGFYQGEIFTENPELRRDVIPVLELLRKVRPTIVTVALDPEGSGPDTHYKVLQAISEALKLYEKEADVSNLRVWGYRNIWYRFHPSEANIYVPVSLNSFAILENAFMKSYGSQKNASFPSWEFDGPFYRLAHKVQVDQYDTIRLCLGNNFFLNNESPRVRAAHGMIYLKELTLDEFYTKSIELRKLTESF